ncbi:MAG: hypothetical protein JEY99_19205 [Spirochaetales bacterium]|nr:hypothetical protein [Spirochaetales bacterium]
MEPEKTFIPESTDLIFGSNINQEEKKEILKEIEEAVSSTKKPMGRSGKKLRPVKNGAIFPTVINLIMLTAVIASFFVSRNLFEQRMGENSQETQYYLSAEGKLLEELRRESEEALEEKDQQIGAIQEELAELDRRSSELSANMEATINAKEQELRREMEAAIATERERLAGEGSTQEEIQAKLAEMENQIRNQNNQALNSFRSQSEAALAEQRRELEQTIALNQSLLDDANAEKNRLEEESRTREAEMASQFEEEKAALEASTQQAQEALSNLAKIQEQQYLLDDQIIGAYRSIIQHINGENFDSALVELASLRSLLTSETVQSIPAYANKQPIDLFILDTLKSNIETTANRAQASSSSLVAAAELLLAAEELAQKGLEAYGVGNQDEARTFLTRALEEIPKLGESYTTLNLLLSASRAEIMKTSLAMADDFSRAGNFTAAVQAYNKAIVEGFPDNQELATSSLNGLLSLYDTRHTEILTANRATIQSLNDQKEEAISALERRQEQALNRIDQQHRQALVALTTEKDDALALLQQKIAEQETTLALQKIRLADAEMAILEATASTEQELEALQAHQAETRQNLESNYQTAMADMEAGYQEALVELKNRYQEEMETMGSEHDLEISEKESSLLTLQEKINQGQLILSDWEEKYSQLQAEYELTSENLLSAKAQNASLNVELTEYKKIESDYNLLKNRMDRLMSTGNPYDFFQAEELLVDFLKNELGGILPGASHIIEKTSEALVLKTSEESKSLGISEGRIQALADILLYTGYLTAGSSDRQASLLEEIKDKASSDSQYSQAVQEIEDLVMEGAQIAAQATSVLGRPQLLGTVSRVTGNSITVEVLADLDIEVNMVISVRRKTRRTDEVVLATGVITAAGRGEVEAELNGNLGAGRVETADLVYVTLN